MLQIEISLSVHRFRVDVDPERLTYILFQGCYAFRGGHGLGITISFY